MKININGVIVPNDDKWIYDYFGIESTSPADVEKALSDADGQDVDININSGGGDVFSGSAIYSAIRAYTGKLNIHVVGLAASAASVIAMAGHSDISPTGQVMIHKVSTTQSGNSADMEKAADILKQADRSIAAAYVAKTGMSEEDALQLMEDETWLTADDAVTNGLIDEIAESHNKHELTLAADTGGLLPKSVINKMTEKRNSLITFFGGEK